jgi:adenylate cyclase
MPPWEITQVVLGLLIPFWLVVHVIGTRGAHQLFGVDDSYAYVLNVLWPNGAWRQSVLLILVWLHGCIGIHFWLRLRPWYRYVQPWLLALALLLPTLALIGFADAGRELRGRAAADPTWLARAAEAGSWPGPGEGSWVYDAERGVLLGFTAVLLGTLGARAVRGLRARYGGRVRLRYPDGVNVSIEPGMSVLEASRAAGVPHASVCGGRGRCSTCRVRLGDGADHLPPPGPDEARVLARIGAPDRVRLACQLRPTRDLAVVPLLPAVVGPQDVRVQVNPGQGMERDVAVMFADLRAFTQMSEGRLPYDVVFLLNQYFKAMGQAVEAQGGRVDKFIGDGIMALFGVDHELATACRQALATARAMAFALEQLNLELVHDLHAPLRIGIGLHVGPAILGQMGYRRATSLTAIGDTVNVAARLEALTKEFDVQMVVSSRLAEHAGVDLRGFVERRIEVRGRRRPLRVRLIGDARALPLDVAPRELTNAPTWTRLTDFRRFLRSGDRDRRDAGPTTRAG